MLKSEFTARTHYCPDDEEYRFIETSYIESPLNMDDFCEQWKCDHDSGRWAAELSLRKAVVKWSAKCRELEEKLSTLEEQLEFYKPYYERAHRAEEAIKMMSSAIVHSQFWVDEYKRIYQQYKYEDKEDAK